MITQVQGSELCYGSRHQTLPGNNCYAPLELTNQNGNSKIVKGNERNGNQSPENSEYQTPIKELTHMNLHRKIISSSGHYSDSSSYDENVRYLPTQSFCAAPDGNAQFDYNVYPPALIQANYLQRSLHSYNSTSPRDSFASQQSADEPRISRTAPPNVTVGEFSNTHHNANSMNCYTDQHSNYSYPHLNSSLHMDVVCKREMKSPSLQWQCEAASTWMENGVCPPTYWSHDTPQYRYTYPANYWPLSGNPTPCSYQTPSTNRCVKQETYLENHTHSPMQQLPFQQSRPIEQHGLSNETRITHTNDENIMDTESTDEMRIFANAFKARRIKLGYTQADVGQALGTLHGSVFSQTTICRFEAGGLSNKNMNKLKPLLTRWLQFVDRDHLTAISDAGRSPSDGASTRKRKKRTCIDSRTKQGLEEHYEIKHKPNTGEIAKIANELHLDKEVVRIWFCNRRQKAKKSQAEIMRMDVS